MAIVYEWKITNLKCYSQINGLSNVVFVIDWRRQASKNNYTTDVYGSQQIEFKAGEVFTPFNNLTKEQIENWLESAIGVDRMSEIDATLATSLEDLINPTTVDASLPWVVK